VILRNTCIINPSSVFPGHKRERTVGWEEGALVKSAPERRLIVAFGSWFIWKETGNPVED
jgi:hypothetical protein